MNVARGDVVLVDYPFTDRSGSKVRPCLVVQNDLDNGRLDDTIVVLITSNTRLAATDPAQLLVDVSTPDGEQTGLLFNSVVHAHNILTIDRSFVRRKVGAFPTPLMEKAIQCVKVSLGIA